MVALEALRPVRRQAEREPIIGELEPRVEELAANEPADSLVAKPISRHNRSRTCAHVGAVVITREHGCTARNHNTARPPPPSSPPRGRSAPPSAHGPAPTPANPACFDHGSNRNTPGETRPGHDESDQRSPPRSLDLLSISLESVFRRRQPVQLGSVTARRV